MPESFPDNRTLSVALLYQIIINIITIYMYATRMTLRG
jgi:hypothetical protein